MAVTYENISTTTLGSTQSSIVFSSIPQTYTDLVLVSFAQHTGDASTGDANLRFNSDSSALYSVNGFYGYGSGSTGYTQTNKTFMKWTYAATNYKPLVIANIMNYSNSTTYKTMLMRANRADSATGATVALWRNTNPITQIFVQCLSFNSNQFTVIRKRPKPMLRS